MPKPSPVIIALTVTFRRPAEIERLIACLGAQTVRCAAHVIVDNAGESSLRETLRAYQSSLGSVLELVYIPNPGNPGVGAGLKAGEEWISRKFEPANYIWVLDDDAVPEPDCLEQLLGGISEQGAGMATPAFHKNQAGEPLLVVDPHSNPLTSRRIKKLSCREQIEVLLPYFPAYWATGVCQLVSLDAIRKMGFYRTDFWMQGEDIEYSHRIAMALGVVVVRDCAVGHYKVGELPKVSEPAHARSFLALIQNLAYMAFHTRYGLRCFLGSWISSVMRYFRTFYRHPGWFVLALVASFGGAVLGRPAGLSPGPAIRSRLKL